VVAYGLGDAGLSGRRAEESLALTRALGHAFGSAIALPGLARLARDRGDDRRATAAFQESLHLWASIGDQESIVQPLAGLAELASVHDQPETAATLVGAIDALAQEAGDFILERCMRFAGDNCDRAAARACAALGEGRFVTCAPPAAPCRWRRPSPWRPRSPSRSAGPRRSQPRVRSPPANTTCSAWSPRDRPIGRSRTRSSSYLFRLPAIR
jgi:hypothetical protein